MRKFDLSLRSSRSSYFATFRHQLTILSKTDALDEEKWLNMLGTFVKDWFRYESHFVHGRDSLVDILKERGLLSESDAVQPLIGKKSCVSHADGWFIVFDTLTLADDRLEAFYDNPNALRDYFRDIGRMVLAAEGRKANDSHADCYQYFCVPEYGTANGRLHFHAVHFMRTLPTGSVDPNFGRR